MKKIFKDWNLFEIISLLVSISIIVVCFILGSQKNYLALVTSIIGIISVMQCSKALVIAPIAGITFSVLYSIVSITQAYYGEALIYIVLMIPIDILAIISWFKNKNELNKDVVTINKIKYKEYLILIPITAMVTVGFYFLLKALNTAQLIVSTISLVTSIVAAYLMLRRSKYYAIGFALNDIVLIVLWSLAVSTNGVAYLPNVISFCVFLYNDIYGFIFWLKEEKSQKANIEKK